MLIVLILVLLFCGGGFYGYSNWGPGWGGGIGIGGILMVLLVCYLLGIFRND